MAEEYVKDKKGASVNEEGNITLEYIKILYF